MLQMRRLLFILVALCSGAVVAQTEKRKQSPEIKNEKIWEKEKKEITIYIGNSEKLKLRSKDFKNYKPWQRKIYKNKVVLTIKKRKQEFGGKAKNRKVWKD